MRRALFHGDLEVLVLIRGGGSRDDLAAFDHEQGVRAVAASRSPVIAAIWHERDVTFAERAADVRASTPSNAAELLVPDYQTELAHVTQTRRHIEELLNGMQKRLVDTHTNLRKELRTQLQHIYERSSHELATTRALVAALDPLMPLERGFAVVRGADNKMLRSVKAAKQQKEISLQFRDGEAVADVDWREV